MKTSVEWLAEYVTLPPSTDELTEALTLAGLEVEGVREVNRAPEHVVIGVITARRAHPNADRLSICTVDAGQHGERQVVCGADNCDPGKHVPLALPGACLSGNLKVQTTKLRGEKSEGMMCSERELGLGDDAAGLMELPDDAAAGAPLQDILGKPDTVVDWEITPNRPDWLSHIGIAREAAAVFDCRDQFAFPEIPASAVAAQSAQEMIDVEVAAPDLCPRYLARVIRNVRIGPSPDWLRKRLLSVGVRPINNVVDVTNFVLLECGQPLHAFDYDRLEGGRIVVRPAGEQETIQTLDGQKCTLSPDNLVIADAEKPVALAGVMGGADTEIDSDTRTVLLESAAFKPPNIRATAKKFGMQTDSSYRFERGISLTIAEFASRRAAELICRLSGGTQLEGCVDVYPNPVELPQVRCRYHRVEQLLGVDVPPESIRDYLRRLGFERVQSGKTEVGVTVPDFRHDIEREVDIIEEIARINGLEAIPAVAAAATPGGSFAEDAYHVIQQAREEFIGLGLDESINYTLLSEKEATSGTGFSTNELISLSNPISSEGACMRPSLLPGLLRNLAHNIAYHHHDLGLFEIGRVMSRSTDTPEERTQAGVLLTGRRHPERFGEEREAVFDFFDLKGLVESWLVNRKLTAFTFLPAEHPAFKPGVCAELYAGKRRIGVLGQVAADLIKDIRVAHPVFIALLELTEIVSLPHPELKYRALPQYPATVRDISAVVPREIQHKQLLETLQQAAPQYLEDVALVDVYQDKTLQQENKSSMTYSLTYRAADRTLTDDEVNKIQQQVRNRLQKNLSVELR